MTDALFYRKPVPLDRTIHRAVGLDLAVASFAFAAGAHAVPMTGVEFPEAARALPIVFATAANGLPVPLAVLGLEEGKNRFVSPDGQWLGPYVPAFIRRYPFILTDSLSVCLDMDAPMVRDGGGEPLFTAEGQDTPLLERSLTFLRLFNSEAERTQAFSAKLAELDLMQAMTVQIVRPDNTANTLEGFAIVDQKKLAALPDVAVLDLFRSGMLGWIYAHLTSLGVLATMAGPGAKVVATPV